jgi:RNA polymerase sigma factor (TIGR02999 family)
LVVRDQADEELLRGIYSELRDMAARLLRSERHAHTLQPTALAHEAYIRLLGKGLRKDLLPQEFLALAVHQMRQILVDYGRKHYAQKRGAGLNRVPLTEWASRIFRDEDSVVALNEALERLGELDPRARSVVELKFFGGMTNAETAAVIGVCHATIEADWQFARAWLYGRLSGAPNPRRVGP